MSRTVNEPPVVPLLDDGARVAGWWHDADARGRIVCDLCPRGCVLKPGDRGFCFVRENRDGQMVLNTYGRSTGFCIDPIEKKPLNHFFPGTSVLSFGTAGCNLGCKFCQNWSTTKSREVAILSERAGPETIAEAARQLGCRSVAFTYNDPIIWAEYAIDTARVCRAAGIQTVAVTAGYIAPAARGPFFCAMDAANVDLKSFSEHFYRTLTLSHLAPVLDTLEWIKAETNVWLEITNLVIPGANDSADELGRLCDWIHDHLGADVPVHFSAFHPDFRLRDLGPTPLATLNEAYEIARRAGLVYVYIGNVNDAERQSTYCPDCGRLVIQRDWYTLGVYELEGNRCRHCGGTVAGRFDRGPGDWGNKRMPVRISRFAREPSTAKLPEKGNATMSHGPDETADADGAGAPPEVTPDQQRSIHAEVCRVVAAAVAGDRPQLRDPEMAGAGRQTVVGCFVTLRRHGRLRGCCGLIGRPTPLADAVVEAAIATATRDFRLPSISPTELPMLDVTISLLHSLRPIRARGEQRVAAVEVGRHGLQIARGGSRGLLLPSVATEFHLDAEHFLQQVCVKAGLEPTAWKDDASHLATFEALVFGDRFARAAVGDDAFQTPRLLRDTQVARLADACRANVVALTVGATPNFYLPDCPDGTVQGVTIGLHLPDGDELRQISQLSIRPGLPLQATLIELAKRAASLLRANPRLAATLDQLKLELTVLSDPAMHGTVADPDLSGIDPQHRAVLVMDNERSAWIYDPARTPDALLEIAVREARVRSSTTATVTSLQAVSTRVPVVVTSLPRPDRGHSVRPPAVAGAFYPDDINELARLVDQLLEHPAPARRRWAGAMVPHAGLIYSGRVAASVLQRIDIPSTIIAVGPKHTRFGLEWAVAPHATWSLPGAQIPSDPDLARALADAIPDLELDAAAHAREHCIEVQLPLLARLAPACRVVGIVIGTGDIPRCQEFARGMARVIGDLDEPPLLLISSDMNHFANDTETRRLDRLALTAAERRDPAQLYATVRREHISMCGMLPAVIVMETLKQIGHLRTCEEVGYATSADVSGDRNRVVGYAGLLFD